MELEINDLLKNKRKELGITQEELADKIFVTKKTVSNWETGKTFPDIDSLIRLAQLYQFSLDDLLMEGAPIVEDIKARAEMKKMLKLSIPPLITNICLLFIILSQRWFGYLSNPILIVISICVLSNFVPLYYFRNKVHQKQKYFLKTWKSIIIILIFIAGIIIISLIPRIIGKN